MKVLTLPKIVASSSSGGGTTVEGQLLVTTRVSGALGFNLPANIKVVSIVGKTTNASANVSMSIVGNPDISLFFGPVDFADNETKTFAPNVYLAAASQIFTTNTTIVAPVPAIFKFLITYIIIPESFT